MPNNLFPAPKSNEYQWRNLYLKQYGICMYPPPMPKNPELAAASARWRRRGDHDATRNSSSHTNMFSPGDDAGPHDASEQRMPPASRDFAFSLRTTSDRVSTESRRRSSGYEGLEVLSDQQLFSADVFSYLSGPKSGSISLLGPQTPLDSDALRPTKFPSILSGSRMGRRSDAVQPRSKSGDEAGKALGCPPSDLVRLQRETWQLLMDNRIMAWFEREAKERGRIAASVQQRLLEIVSWKPGPQTRVAFAIEKPTEDSAKKTADNEEGTKKKKKKDETVGPFTPSSPFLTDTNNNTADAEEGEKLMQTLEQFAPYFAVISSPEVVQQFSSSTAMARYRGRRNEVPTIIGLPLFSQYATWRETYENRKAWNLAPFSFFLIHDESYNYSHIVALYVLLDLIGSSAHTHTANCVINERQRQFVVDFRQRRSWSGKETMMESTLCPLYLAQQLTEDLLLAYEQSTSRTTLSMALFVHDFLTDVIVDPDTASCFLSINALKRQCGCNSTPPQSSPSAAAPSSSYSAGGKGAKPTMGSSSGKDEKNDFGNEPLKGENNEGKKAEQSENIKEEISPAPADDELVDWGSLKKLNDDTFDELFALVNWFVDVPTANSSIPTEPKIVPVSSPSPTPSAAAAASLSGHLRRQSSVNSAASPGSVALDSKKSSQHHFGSEVSAVLSKDTNYVVGRTREYDATMSIVEAMTRYEVQRQRILDMRSKGTQQSVASPVSANKKSRKKRATFSRAAKMSEPIDMPELSLGTTILATPLSFITTYIRLHGAPWLRELLSRLFNILRRESVLLYVNGFEMEAPPPRCSSTSRELLSQLSISEERSTDITSSFGRETGRWRHLSQKEVAYYQRMERLEDLICQDIQYVMGEFFGSLFGKRSMTRLPQGISIMLTNFCTTIHLHLLRQHMNVDLSIDKPTIAVRKCVAEMRQQRLTGGGGPSVFGQHQYDATDRLIRSIENNRLARFILFDCWILPSINNAVEFGFISESASNHLRWNLDAFGRYLKILANAPFVASKDNADVYIHTVSPSRLYSYQNAMSPTAEKKSRVMSDVSLPPRCDTLKLPPLINGVYDITTGSLMQLFRDPGEEEMNVWQGGFSFGEMSSSVNSLRGRGFETSSALPELRKTWSDLSGALSSLNETIGITGGDAVGDEVFVDDTDVTPMRILNIFCSQASNDLSAKVVVSEYDVSPSIAAACISKTFSLVSGQHPIIRNASLSRSLVGQFRSSPYLTCLIGVLLHPRMVAKVLDNVSQNSRAFYNALMKPLKEESMLSLISSLVMARKNMPLVDSNELISLIAAIQVKSAGSGIGGNGATDEDEKVYEQKKRSGSMATWETAARRLLQQRALVTTGFALPPACTIHPLLRRTAPTNPYPNLRATQESIIREMQRPPTCLDTWWRAMVVALTVKAMNVIEECSDSQSMQWEEWCHAKVHEMQREYRGLCSYFIQHKGGRLDISRARALSCAKEKKRRSSSTTGSLKKSSLMWVLEEPKKEKKKNKKKKRTLSKPKKKTK